MKQKIAGVLGGKGPEATEMLFRLILKNSFIQREEDHLRIIIDNNPKIPKPALGITGEGDNPIPALIDTAKNLEKAGANFIVIPCNSAHYFLEDISGSINIPIVSIITETVNAAKSAKCSMVGLMATTGLVNSGIYQREFKNSGIFTVMPEKNDQYRLMQEIIKFKDSGRIDGLSKTAKDVALSLINKGANGLALACTEIPVALSSELFDVPCFDTIEILALAAIREATL